MPENRVIHCEASEVAATRLTAMLHADDVVLVKGVAGRANRSRGGAARGGVHVMLYHLLFPLHTQISGLNVVQYITFRTAAAGLTALVISLTMGPWTIRTLRGFQIGQVVRDDGPATHQSKAGTPTMGGVLILVAAVVPTLLWVDLTNAYVWIAMLSTLAFGLVGFVDDYLKVVRKTHRGLRPRYKLIGQATVAAGGRALAVVAERTRLLQH